MVTVWHTTSNVFHFSSEKLTTLESQLGREVKVLSQVIQDTLVFNDCASPSLSVLNVPPHDRRSQVGIYSFYSIVYQYESEALLTIGLDILSTRTYDILTKKCFSWQSRASEMLKAAKSIISELCNHLMNFHSYTEQRLKIYPTDSSSEPLSIVNIKVVSYSFYYVSQS